MNEATIEVRRRHMDAATYIVAQKERVEPLVHFIRRTGTPIRTIRAIARGIGRPIYKKEAEQIRQAI